MGGDQPFHTRSKRDRDDEKANRDEREKLR